MLQSSATKQRPGANTSMKNMIDLGLDDEDLIGTMGGAQEVEGRDVDPDALAFIKAKRHVDDLQKAKKFEKRIGGHQA